MPSKIWRILKSLLLNLPLVATSAADHPNAFMRFMEFREANGVHEEDWAKLAGAHEGLSLETQKFLFSNKLHDLTLSM